MLKSKIRNVEIYIPLSCDIPELYFQHKTFNFNKNTKLEIDGRISSSNRTSSSTKLLGMYVITVTSSKSEYVSKLLELEE